MPCSDAEVVELVAGTARVDEVRGEQRVVGRRATEAKGLRVVRDDLGRRRGRARDRRVRRVPPRTGPSCGAIATRSPSQATPTRPRGPCRAPTRSMGPCPRRDEALPQAELRRACRPVPSSAAELEAPEDLLQLRAVGRRGDQLARVDVERQVSLHGGEELRVARLVGVLAHGLAPRGRQLGCVLDHALERSVLRDQLTRGLVADAWNARDVVRRVSLETDEVRHLVGPHAVAKLDALGRVDVDVRDPTRSHHQAHVVRAELEGVAVGGDDAGLDRRLVGTRGERGDHVVRLPALELEVAVAERLHDRPEVRELLAQQVRHRPAPFLVRLGDLGAVYRPRVPGDRHASRPVVREQLEEHVREAEQRVRGLPVGRLELLGQREEGAVGEVVAVHEEQLGVAHGTVVELELGAGDRLRRHRLNAIVRTAHGAPRDPPVRRRAPRRRRGAACRAPPAAAGGGAAPARALRGTGRRARRDRGAVAAGRRLGRGRARGRSRRPGTSSERPDPIRSGARTSGSSSPATPSRSPSSLATSTARPPVAGSTKAGIGTTCIVPACDAALVEAWFHVGFGMQHVHAIRELSDEPTPSSSAVQVGTTPRSATSTPWSSSHRCSQLTRSLSPVFGPRARSRTRTSCVPRSWTSSAKPEFGNLVAEIDDRVVGNFFVVPLEMSSMHVGLGRPDGASFLGFAVDPPGGAGRRAPVSR